MDYTGRQRKWGGSLKLPPWVCVGMILILGLLMLPQPVAAGGGTPPCRLYGTVQVNGDWVANGTLITVSIDGVASSWTASAFVDSVSGDSVYFVDVPADDASTAAKDGGVSGDIVRFAVRYEETDYPAAQTGVWSSGGGPWVVVNLAVETTSPVVATLSNQPTGTVNYSNATITVGGTDVVGYEWKLDSGSWSGEMLVSSHIVLSGLSDGWHTLWVIGKKSDGKWQSESLATTATWKVDTTWPLATLSGQPAGTVNYSNATITVGGIGVVSYEYQLDGNVTSAERPVGTTITLSGLGDGLHAVLVVGKNALGTWQPWDSGTSAIWTIDSTLAFAVLTGQPAGAVNYRSADITVGGNGVVYYKWKLDGGTFSSEMGKDVLIHLDGLADGPHTVYVVGRNAAGYWQGDANATTASWTVDTVAPVCTLSGQPAGVVKSTTANITVGDASVVFYKYKLDGGSWSNETAVGTHIELASLSDGAHTVSVVGEDAAGNWQADGAATTASWTVDTVPPTATVSGQPSGAVSYKTADIVIGGAGVVTYMYRLDGGTLSNETVVSSHIVLSGLGDGTHTVSVVGKDAAGNWQAETATTIVSWTVDSMAPVATLAGEPSGAVNYNTAGITVGGAGVVAYKYKLDSGSWSGETTVSTHIAVSSLGDGVHTVSAIGKDAAGNWQAESAATAAMWMVDTTAPSVPTLDLPGNKGKTESGLVSFDWEDASDASGIAFYELQLDNSADGSSPLLTKSGLTTSQYTLTSTEALPDGTYYWRVRATDAAGNAGDWSEIWSVTVAASAEGSGFPVGAVVGGIAAGVIVLGLLVYFFVVKK